MKWYALSWQEIISLFETASSLTNLEALNPILSAIYLQSTEKEKQQLRNTYQNVVKHLNFATHEIPSRHSMKVRLINLLTNVEYEKIQQLQQELKDAVTQEEVDYYSNQIHLILDQAEERMNAPQD